MTIFIYFELTFATSDTSYNLLVTCATHVPPLQRSAIFQLFIMWILILTLQWWSHMSLFSDMGSSHTQAALWLCSYFQFFYVAPKWLTIIAADLPLCFISTELLLIGLYWLCFQIHYSSEMGRCCFVCQNVVVFLIFSYQENTSIQKLTVITPRVAVASASAEKTLWPNDGCSSFPKCLGPVRKWSGPAHQGGACPDVQPDQ